MPDARSEFKAPLVVHCHGFIARAKAEYQAKGDVNRYIAQHQH